MERKRITFTRKETDTMSEEKKEFVKHEAPRPEFPKRAIITGGMPYGNKKLHFGHIGGVFVFADVYARFLRDRLGDENVIFVSGTDCYGSPIARATASWSPSRASRELSTTLLRKTTRLRKRPSTTT